MTTAQSNRSCPQCEQPLPADAPQGLCPECLMLGGLETVPLPEGYRSSGRLPESGETFGEYQIGRELGRGGMGAVFEAEQLETGRRVALKLLNHQLDSPESRARFLREGRLAASINHPNSVYVFGTEEIDEMPAIVMELVNGGTLEERVKSRGALPVGEAVDAVLQIIEGLSAAKEAGILHRDVKPGNCFENAEGTVKIGDFGLSISTEARDEKHLTMEGAVFGTPAFSSPEQLRGDGLDVRSDIYAVGATLFYLLTGRPVFGGKSVAQLFANVLEQATPSPRDLQPGLPAELAAVVVRCLQKIPGERFGSYAELRNALAPFRSASPVPAPLPLRFAAGVIDWAAWTGLMSLGQVLIFGGMAYAERPEAGTQVTLIVVSVILWALYFGLMESRRGFSIGKLVCGLRVTGPDGNPPGLRKATLRSLLILVPPSLATWIYAVVDPGAYELGIDPVLSYTVLACFYGVLILLFCCARSRNGFSSVGDLLTGTRVVRRKSFHPRPSGLGELVDPVETGEQALRVGPFYIIEEINADWSVGYDSRLLRKVWIRKVAAGTPPVSAEIRQMGRAGRLRWLAGRRESDENWDAFEFPRGRSLRSLVANGAAPSWSSVRYWLRDLAEEFEAAEKDGTLPEILSIDRIWITDSGRAKLLDFPVTNESQNEGAGKSVGGGELIAYVAALAEAPIPVHAMEFRESVADLTAPTDLVESVSPLLERNVTVSTARRFVLLLGCLSFPVVGVIVGFFGMEMYRSWSLDHPEIMKLMVAVEYYEALVEEALLEVDSPVLEVWDERLFSIYISSHYKELISDPEQWNSLAARSLMDGSVREFVERSVRDCPDPDAQEIAEANTAIGGFFDWQAGDELEEPPAWISLGVGMVILVFCVQLPAIVSAFVFRKGLLMQIAGVTVSRKEGTRASRLRCLWRSLITWSPVFLGAVVITFSPMESESEMFSGITLTMLVMAVPCIVSLCFPRRSLQDRLAGTCLVAT